MPVADYISTEPESARRSAENIQHNRRGAGIIKEIPAGMELLPTFSHWWKGLSPIPTDKSDVVVTGTISQARSFLSSNKSGVYSEFAFGIAEVLKGSASVTPGSSIFVERSGGGVRFPSGRVQYYSEQGKGFPEVGKTYLLFTTDSEVPGDFEIITGYEISGGRVWALDGAASSSGGAPLPFDKFDGDDVSEFLASVRQAIARQ